MTAAAHRTVHLRGETECADMHRKVQIQAAHVPVYGVANVFKKT